MRLLLLLAVLLLAACVPGRAQSPLPAAVADQQPIHEILATVRYIPLAGGFFGLVAEDGGQYDPINLAPEFQRDGLAVKAQVRPLRGVVSYRMWGTIVEVVSMEQR